MELTREQISNLSKDVSKLIAEDVMKTVEIEKAEKYELEELKAAIEAFSEARVSHLLWGVYVFYKHGRIV